MSRKLFRLAAIALALTFATSQAFAQVTFGGVVPHADESPKAEQQDDNGHWYNGEAFVPRFLTLDLDQRSDDLILPQSTLILPGSRTIPNSEFLSETLGLMGFETPTAPYIALDSVTHKMVETYSFGDLTGFLNAQPDGSVFILGLDFHAGFIRKEKGKITFLHSETGAVVSEPLEDARPLKDSQIFIIGDLSERARIVVGEDAI